LAERKTLKVALLLLLLIKGTWQTGTGVRECACPKDLECMSPCPGYFISREISVPHLFSFWAKERVLSPWSESWVCRFLREQKKWTIWFLLAVPKSQNTVLTSHFLSLVFSDRLLIQSGRSGTWPAACTENRGFDRQLFLGNRLCDGCTEQHSARKLFDVSTQSEAIWKNGDDQ